MEYLGGKESGKAGSAGRETFWAVTPFTIKMPISRDDLEPLPLHIVKSPLWCQGSEPLAVGNVEEPKPEFFKKFSPNSKRNDLVPKQNALSLRYSTNQGTIDVIALPMVSKPDVRIELHEHQITLIALARDQGNCCVLDIVDEENKPSMIYHFSIDAKNVFAVVAGYRKGEVQLFLGRMLGSSWDQPYLLKNRRRGYIHAMD